MLVLRFVFDLKGIDVLYNHVVYCAPEGQTYSWTILEIVYHSGWRRWGDKAVSGGTVVSCKIS